MPLYSLEIQTLEQQSSKVPICSSCCSLQENNKKEVFKLKTDNPDLLGSKNPSLGSARSQGLQYCESLSLGMKAKWQGTWPSFVIMKRSLWSCRNFTFSNENCRKKRTMFTGYSAFYGKVMCVCVRECVTSLLLRDTDGRKSFSILSIARTISSKTFLWRSSFTTLTCFKQDSIHFISCVYYSKEWDTVFLK